MRINLLLFVLLFLGLNQVRGQVSFQYDQLGNRVKSKIEIKVLNKTAIGNIEKEVKDPNTLSFKIYPNPANNCLFVDLPDGTFSVLRITDMTGKLVYETQLIQNHNVVDISQLNQGFYIAELDKSKANIWKLFKQ